MYNHIGVLTASNLRPDVAVEGGMGLFPALPLEDPPVFAIISPVQHKHQQVDYPKNFAITAVKFANCLT